MFFKCFDENFFVFAKRFFISGHKKALFYGHAGRLFTLPLNTRYLNSEIEEKVGKI